MPVRCAKCGEELLGAVNRCWKCGQQFLAQPTLDGAPPAQKAMAAVANQPALEATVLDDLPATATGTAQPLPGITAAPTSMGIPIAPPPLLNPLATPPKLPALRRPVSPATNVAAMGGMVATLVLGVFALALAWWRFEAAIVGLLGLIMGVWGLYSPRRGWALLGMLLCCLAIVLGTISGVLQLNAYLNRNAPIELPEVVEP